MKITVIGGSGLIGGRPGHGMARHDRVGCHLAVLPRDGKRFFLAGGGGKILLPGDGLGDVGGGCASSCHVTSHMCSCRPPRSLFYRRSS